MLGKLRIAKRLFRDLPHYSKLAYCLLRDDRVPATRKAGLAAALAVGLNPVINIREFIPVIGELDALAVTLLSLRLFIASAPGHIVDEHRRLIEQERSAFDLDLRSGETRLAQFTDTITRRLRPGSIAAGSRDVTEVRGSAPVNKRKVSA